MSNRRPGKYRRVFLKIFDFNKDNKIDWPEYIIPIILLAILDIITGLIANYISMIF